MHLLSMCQRARRPWHVDGKNSLQSFPSCICAPCNVTLCFFQSRSGTSPAPLEMRWPRDLLRPTACSRSDGVSGNQASGTDMSFGRCSQYPSIKMSPGQPVGRRGPQRGQLRCSSRAISANSAADHRCLRQPTWYQPSLAQKTELTSLHGHLGHKLGVMF